MTGKYLKLDADFVKHEITRLLTSYPELAEDETLRLDMIVGETDALNIINRALAERQEAEMMAGAIHVRKEAISARAARYERKSEAMKGLIKSVMKAAQLDKLQLAEATLSITKPRQSVGIEDLEALPQGYYRTTKVADKDAIRKAFDSGESVPGAAMVLGSEGLTIRTK